MILKGFDVSSFQTSDIDFGRTKEAGMTFVIVRAGFGEKQSKTFVPQVEGALEAGLDAGAYWYSYAVTVEEAEAEAEAFLEALKPYRGKLTYPVWFDQEYEKQILALTKQQRTDICLAFLQKVQDAGWYTGLYSSLDWLRYKVDDGQLRAFDKWVAQHAPRLTYTGAHGMWQYDNQGTVSGVPGEVDLDQCFKDYPEIIRRAGLNGFSECGEAEAAAAHDPDEASHDQQ